MDNTVYKSDEEIMKETIFNMRAMVAYVDCALWCGLDDEDRKAMEKEKRRKICGDDCAPQLLETMASDLEDFIGFLRKQTFEDLPLLRSFLTPERIGHDFWLTRNGHGAGFWDRGDGALGDKLTEVAKQWGSFNLYIGDDGQIYGY